jgi:ABC-type sugar transport system substrate-binding protein
MRITAYLAVTVLAAVFLYGLNASLDLPDVQRSHLLIMSDVAGEEWDRTLEGAQAAARDLGIELDIQATPASASDPLRAAAHNLDATAYNGIALSLSDPDFNRDLINDLADRTKVVTIGNDFADDVRRSHRLCHIGSHQGNIGVRAARLICVELARPGKIALLVSKTSDLATAAGVAERLEGFKEELLTYNSANPDYVCRAVQTIVDTSTLDSAAESMSAILADPELAHIVAFDAPAAEAALKVLSSIPNSRRLPIVALESSRTILDAIADGSLFAAVYHDAYRDGYTAIERLDFYCHADGESLPKRGYGHLSINAEVVRKENVASYRPRLGS